MKVCLAILAAACLARGAGPPGVWLDVPFAAQQKNGCGAASLTMVMQYWENQRGEPDARIESEATIERALDSHARGVANSTMETFLTANGYRAFAFAGSWGDLRENLNKGRPLIIALGPNGATKPLHYVVVTGMDWVHDFVFVNDPAQRKLMRVAWSEFEAEWKATGNWTLLAVPK